MVQGKLFPELADKLQEKLGCGDDNLVGKIVIGMVQLDVVDTGPDTHHGTWIYHQVVGKILAPAERPLLFEYGTTERLCCTECLVDLCSMVLGGIKGFS